MIIYHEENKNYREEGKMMLPEDPIMLMSVINTKLRDDYENPEALWEGLDVDGQAVLEKLSAAGYHYDRERNQFVSQ